MKLSLSPKTFRVLEALLVLSVLVSGIYLYWRYEYSPRPVGFDRNPSPAVEAIYSRQASVSSKGNVRIVLMTDRVAPGCSAGDPLAIVVDIETDESMIGCWHANKNTIVISWQDNSTHLYLADTFEELKGAKERIAPPSPPSHRPPPTYQKGTT